MKSTEIAYIAGLIDGEAYIGIKKRSSIPKDCINPLYHARIQIRMVDEKAISFIQKILGGNSYKEKVTLPNRRQLFCYQVSDRKAEEIIKRVIPYLLVKKEVARIVLEFRILKQNAYKNKTKEVGEREFQNKYKTKRVVKNKAYSTEFINELEKLYLKCKQLNKVGK